VIVLELLGVGFAFGIYSIGIAYTAWKLGRQSKWEEVNLLPPSSVATIIDPQNNNQNLDSREKPKSLMED
jgi:hypothetical protein